MSEQNHLSGSDCSNLMRLIQWLITLNDNILPDFQCGFVWLRLRLPEIESFYIFPGSIKEPFNISRRKYFYSISKSPLNLPLDKPNRLCSLDLLL